ncbi:hypothetical protein J6O48_01950 [bacterium]|nr:hypothetical protein [bacterium]
MTEIVSVPMDLVFVSDVVEQHNLKWSSADFDGTAKCEFVFSTNCPDNIEDCLTATGTLNVDVMYSADVKLRVDKEASDVNALYVSENVTVNIDDNVDIKGIFLRKKSNGYVLGYMISLNPLRFCNTMGFEEGNVLAKLYR